MGRSRERDGAVSRQHGHRHAAGRRQAVPRIERPLHRPGTLRAARPRRRRAEVLAATTKPTSIAAASACSTSVRCSGATAGRWPARTSRKALTRSNRRARARRSNSRSKACRSAGRADAAHAGFGAGGAGAARALVVAARAGPGRGAPPSRRHRPAGTGAAHRAPIPAQTAAQVSTNWPAGAIDVRLSPYMTQAQQKWQVTPVADAGGYPGSPFFKITIAGTDRALAATADRRTAYRGGVQRRARAVVAHRSTRRRLVSRHAQGHARRQRAAGAVGRRQQQADAHPLPSRQRSGTLAVQDALTSLRYTRGHHAYPPTSLRAGFVQPARSASLAARHAHRVADCAAPRPPAATLTRPTSPTKAPDADGFLRRWLVLEPIRTTGQLSDSAVRTLVGTTHFPGQLTTIPRARRHGHGRREPS